MLSEDFLSRYKNLFENVTELKEKYIMLKIKYESLGFTSANSDDKVMGGSINPDKFTGLLIKIMDTEKDLQLAETILKEYHKLADCRINELSNNHYKDVLRLKYFNFLGMNQIAKKLNLSVQWVCKLHKKALREFEKKYYT